MLVVLLVEQMAPGYAKNQFQQPIEFKAAQAASIRIASSPATRVWMHEGWYCPFGVVLLSRRGPIRLDPVLVF